MRASRYEVNSHNILNIHQCCKKSQLTSINSLLIHRLLKSFTMRDLLQVLTYDFSPRQGDPKALLDMTDARDEFQRMNTLEVAVQAHAKHFISNPLVQEVLSKRLFQAICPFTFLMQNYV